MNNNDLYALSKEELITNILLLRQQVAELKRLIFGQKRERFIPSDSAQATLFDMEELSVEQEYPFGEVHL